MKKFTKSATGSSRKSREKHDSIEMPSSGHPTRDPSSSRRAGMKITSIEGVRFGNASTPLPVSTNSVAALNVDTKEDD
jgi:hypothetical protein